MWVPGNAVRIRAGWYRAVQWGTVGVLLVTTLSGATVFAAPVRSLDYPFGTDLKEIARLTFQWGIFMTVAAAAIFIAIGAYFYLAGAGNAKMAEQGKEYIQRALFGLVLGLLAYVILQTISPQFIQLNPPSLGGGR